MSNEEMLADIRTAIEAREAEIWGYQINIANYEYLLLHELPNGEKPQHIGKHKPGQVPAADAQEWAMFQFRDEIEARLLTERIELEKSLMVRRALLKLLADIEDGSAFGQTIPQ